MGRAQHNCVALIDSGVSHSFLLATVAREAGLVLDTSQHLQVHMADGKLRASQGLTHNVQVEFAPGVMQVWDFWVVPLAMDAILGLPWLRGVQPAIDWQLNVCFGSTRAMWFGFLGGVHRRATSSPPCWMPRDRRWR